MLSLAERRAAARAARGELPPDASGERRVYSCGDCPAPALPGLRAAAFGRAETAGPCSGCRRPTHRFEVLRPTTLDLDRPLKRCRVIVFDTETTGTDPTEARIVEVAAVLVRELGASEPEVVFRSRVNPGVPIPSGATDVHGITDDQVEHAPSWREVWPKMLQALGPEPFIAAAYNVPYDHVVLEHEVERHDHPTPRWMMWNLWLDPLVLVKGVDRFESGKRLREAAQRRGIVHAEHGAAADAVVAAQLLGQLLVEAAKGVRDRDRIRLQMPAGLSLREYLVWQRNLALDNERDSADYASKSGRKTPLDLPWHRLEGVEPPPGAGPAKPTPAKCKSCNADILWLVNDKGTRCPVDPDQYEVVTFHALKAAGLDAAAFSRYPTEQGFVGTESAAGVALPSELRPDLPRSLLRRSHFSSCPQAGTHRRTA